MYVINIYIYPNHYTSWPTAVVTKMKYWVLLRETIMIEWAGGPIGVRVCITALALFFFSVPLYTTPVVVLLPIVSAASTHIYVYNCCNAVPQHGRV